MQDMGGLSFASNLWHCFPCMGLIVSLQVFLKFI